MQIYNTHIRKVKRDLKYYVYIRLKKKVILNTGRYNKI